MQELLDKLAGLAKLQQAATPGPWLNRADWCPQDITVRDTRPGYEDDDLRVAVQPHAYQSAGNWPANAAFIAGASAIDFDALHALVARPPAGISQVAAGIPPNLQAVQDYIARLAAQPDADPVYVATLKSGITACIDATRAAGHAHDVAPADNSIGIYGEWEMQLRERVEAWRKDFCESEVVSEMSRLFQIIDALRSELGRSGGEIHDLKKSLSAASAAGIGVSSVSSTLLTEAIECLKKAAKWPSSENELNAGIENALPLLEALAATPSLVTSGGGAGEWVSVKADMPQSKVTTEPDGSITLAHPLLGLVSEYHTEPIYGYYNQEEFVDINLDYQPGITHWCLVQPLPKSPTA